MKRVTNIMLSSILFFSLVISGCGGPPQNNPLLTEAEQFYHATENDSLVVMKAPVALKEAEEALERSRQVWKDEGNKELVEHYAYISKRKTQIARETAEMNAAQEEVEKAEARRKEVLIEARKAEAIAAEQRAEQAIKELRKEKAEAQKAKARAQELADKLSEMEAQQTERGMVLTLSDVLFDFDSARLNSGAEKVVRELTGFLNEYPERKILIEGYTDSIGEASYNQRLSQRRADALKNALTRKGVSLNRIQTVGYGEEYPVATNMNEAGRQQNRRVEIIVSNENGVITQRTE